MITENINPFQAPKAQLELSEPGIPGGSLEDAVAGRYDLSIEEVMRDAWGLTKGFKASFWGAGIIIYGVFMVAGFVVRSALGAKPNLIVSLVVNGVLGGVMAPFMMGMIMLSVRRAAGLPVSFSTAFSYIHKAPTAIAAGLLTTLLTYVGSALLVLPGIYLAVAYGMTMPLIADRNLGVWQAMETSRKAVTRKWFRIFGLYLLVAILVMLSVLPLGIPLIWTVPWAMLTLGVAYHRIFGVASATPPGSI